MTLGDQPTGMAPTSEEEGGFEAASWLGRTIDERYKIEELLGQGGMGAVFLAEHVKLQKKVALKVILPQFAGNGEVAERFAREAMASAKLEHPHVASALDYGTLAEGGAYLVMQLARGPSLRAAVAQLAEGKRGWRYACEIGAQVADALSAAHAAGIVHRDLKPENVMLEPREDGSELVKVLDFGIARVIDEVDGSGAVTKLTRVGTIIGTPGYMSPEQALGEPVDARADLYALGVILWEISAGHELFTETEVTALVTKQLTTEPPRIGTIATDTPAELDALVARLLARDKNDRPERAGEVRDTLKRLAFAATVERMSLAGSTSGAFPAPAMPSTSSARSSMLDSLPPQLAAHVAQIGRAIGPSVRQQPIVFLVLGAAGLFAFIALLSFVIMCAGGSVTPTDPVVTAPIVPITEVGTHRPIPRGVEPPPTQPFVPPPTPEGFAVIPAFVAADFEAVVHDSGRAARRAAASRILALPREGLPPIVWRVAELEDDSGCESRREIVVAIGEIGDPRALPALERIDHNRRGCGFLRSQDCYRCLRTQLSHALSTLRAH